MAESRSVAFYVRQAYQLPPSDPRWLALTPDEIYAEYWRLVYYHKHLRGEPVAEAEFTDEGFARVLDAVERAEQEDDPRWIEVALSEVSGGG